jgi:two-component system sensor kinase FixL
MQGEGALGIKTRSDAAAGTVLIEIADTGRGIDPDVMNRIFQPFFTTKPRGTGLGLAISKRLIEDHRGGISIERNPAGGATFKIVLPIAQFEGVHTT